jgi:HlyD family secretion protein
LRTGTAQYDENDQRRIAFWGAVGAALAAATVIMTRPQPVPVDFAAVSRGPMAETLDHEGRTRVRERYVVSAPVAGRVLRIELRPGDRVVANQTVIATFAPGASSLLDARSRAGATSRVREAEAAGQVKAQRTGRAAPARQEIRPRAEPGSSVS